MNHQLLRYLFLLAVSSFCSLLHAAEVPDNDSTYLELRKGMADGFDSGDSILFFTAIAKLENYLLAKGDMHKYYTQRCNEVIFLLNQEHVFEAYRLSLGLSKEMRERKLDREMYQVLNMLGHVYSYCGNTDMARRCYMEALERVEKEKYLESIPSICMNLAHEEMDANPEKAMYWLDRAEAATDSPYRLQSIAATRAVYSFRLGDVKAFREGYSNYKKQEAEGISAVYGFELEIYQHLLNGRTAQALSMIEQRGGRADQAEMKAFVYEYLGNWQQALAMRKEQMAAKDSVDAIILSNSMQGIQNEMDLYEADQQVARQRIITLTTVVVSLLIVSLLALAYGIVRRRQVKQLKAARDRAMESDRMKTAFISHISHEIRTPLNIVNGFSQVLVDSSMQLPAEEQQSLAGQIRENTQLIVSLVDELIDLSIIDSTTKQELTDHVAFNDLARSVVEQYKDKAKDGVEVILKTELPDDACLLTNRMMLKKVMGALVDNALKYTEKGEVRVMMKKMNAVLTIVVEDTGCGISDTDAERIFDRFEKLDTFKSGLGLGLSLARAMTIRLNGTLTLDKNYRKGARFVVTLPR